MLTIHIAQETPKVYQVLDDTGRAIAHFRELKGESRKDAERFIETRTGNKDGIEFERFTLGRKGQR